MAHSKEKNKSTLFFKKDLMADLLDKDFKTNVLRRSKIYRNKKKYEQNRNIIKETENLKKNIEAKKYHN